MSVRILHDFVDYTYGFPVCIAQVEELADVPGGLPLIDYEALDRAVLGQLACKSSRLTGNEVRFIRRYREMTLTDFAKRFGLSHVAAVKWEKTGDAPASMTLSTEKLLRLEVLIELGWTPDAIIDWVEHWNPEGQGEAMEVVRVHIPLFSERKFVSTEQEYDISVDLSCSTEDAWCDEKPVAA